MRLFFVGLFLTVFFLISTRAQATALGENIAAVSAQSKAAISPNNLKISAKISSLGAAYSTREVFDGMRTEIEFVDANGVVFAVRWSGQGMPNLSQAFGKYYDDFRTAVLSRVAPRNRKSAFIETSELAFSNYSNGSTMFGFVYLIKHLPAGLAPEDLK